MKICFKCGKPKPETEFYKHPSMGDGLLGKCKTCTKTDSENRRIEKLKDPEWAEKERERHRLKQARYREEGTACVLTGEARAGVNKRHRLRYPEKAKARQKSSNAIRDGKLERKPCEKCGQPAEAHHEDYSKPLEIRWLCPKHHAQRHIQLRKLK